MRYWFFFVVLLIWSCEEIEDCDIESSQDWAVVRFFYADSTAEVNEEEVAIPRGIAFDQIYESNESFYIFAIGDSIGYSSAPFPPPGNDSIVNDSIQGIILPLDPSINSVSYTFELEGEQYNLNLDYSRGIEIFYHECEPDFTYTLDSAYSRELDSVVLVGAPINRNTLVNVEIYL